MNTHDHSAPFIEIMNLCEAAKWHRQNCRKECNVSLLLLRSTAMRILYDCWAIELQQAREAIERTDWT